MSALERDFLKTRLGSLPLARATRPDDDADDEDEAADGLGSLNPAVPTTIHPRKLAKGTDPAAYSDDASPISASDYFEEALLIDPGFRAYYTPPRLSKPSDRGTVFVCHHGAGYSALSFACVADQLRARTDGKVGCLAFDARGHGRTTLDDGDAAAAPVLSLETLSDDLVVMLSKMYPDRTKAPQLVLVGHSMGGAVVADACNRVAKEVADVLGVVVLDVVEGSAIEALQSMRSLIASRPKTFATPEEAVTWQCVELIASHTLNNLASARVSVPPLLKASSSGSLVWRTDLAATEPYWQGWFTGLSNKFLACRAAKLLVLAGTDRLDTELMIGQMQGKYQLVVMQDVGHCLQEDAPDRLAETLLLFMQRNERLDLSHIKKVGQA